MKFETETDCAEGTYYHHLLICLSAKYISSALLSLMHGEGA